MSEQKILPCRICGSKSTERADKLGFFVESYCKHQICGPTMLTREEAISEWNKMMQTEVSATVEFTGTCYRDRVDRMFSAIIVKGVYGAENIARQAIEYIDVIDKAIAEREARG